MTRDLPWSPGTRRTVVVTTYEALATALAMARPGDHVVARIGETGCPVEPDVPEIKRTFMVDSADGSLHRALAEATAGDQFVIMDGDYIGNTPKENEG